ncbi:MAG: type VI secretion system contractile sheath large subunit [Pseudomonadota bacterium]
MAQEQLDSQGQTAEVETEEEFSREKFMQMLEENFNPPDDDRKQGIADAVDVMVEQAMLGAPIIGDDVYGTVAAMRAEIDQRLSEQMNAIIHNEEFQALESAWRGLHHLVMNTPTGSDLKIKVLNVSKEECRKTFKKFRDEAWDQSPLFNKIYEAEYGSFRGEPYAAFVCDYNFDHSGKDIEVMRGLSKIGAASHAPFISAAAPSLLQMEDWTEIQNPRDLKALFDSPDYMAWRGFRESDDSRYMALTMPRFIGRDTYGENGEPVDEFAFEEVTNGDHEKFLWCNSAYAFGVKIAQSFAHYGWCSQIRGVTSGGLVEDLPVPAFPTSSGGIDYKCPTEYSIPNRREAELSECGLIPLIHGKNTDTAAFVGAQTVHKPAKYEGKGGKEATANANISARLPYIFASCRFAHYLKRMVYDWVGRSMTKDKLERELHNWVLNYVAGNPETASDHVLASQPLSAAKVEVFEDEENPGYYKARFELAPHYQLEGVDATLSMVSKIHDTKG